MTQFTALSQILPCCFTLLCLTLPCNVKFYPRFPHFTLLFSLLCLTLPWYVLFYLAISHFTLVCVLPGDWRSCWSVVVLAPGSVLDPCLALALQAVAPMKRQRCMRQDAVSPRCVAVKSSTYELVDGRRGLAVGSSSSRQDRQS